MKTFKSKRCQQCKREFTPAGPAAKFCGVCGTERSKRRNRERMKVLRARLGCQVGAGKGGANAIGKADNQYKTGISYFRRRRDEIRAERRYCERCAKDLINAEKGHWGVHHKDRNRSNNEDWNLELLCKRCHQLEHDCQNSLPRPQPRRQPKRATLPEVALLTG